MRPMYLLGIPHPYMVAQACMSGAYVGEVCLLRSAFEQIAGVDLPQLGLQKLGRDVDGRRSAASRANAEALASSAFW
jgi:hypothetical protein